MLKAYFVAVNEIAQTKQSALAAELIAFKQAVDAAPAPSMQDRAMAAGNQALAAGKEYAPSIGYGAGAGALAGVPIALLANAIFGKDKSVRGHLRSALMGAILGGGAGAVGGGALKYLHGHGYGDKIDSGIDTLSGLAGKGLGAMGLDGVQGEQGPNVPRSQTAGKAIKGILS